MISGGKYLLEVSLSTGVIFLIYHLGLKHNTFFKANRAFLLIGLLASFILPVVTLPFSVSFAETTPLSTDVTFINTVYVPIQFDIPEQSGINFTAATTAIYSFVVALLVFRFLAGIIRTIVMQNKAFKTSVNGVTVYVKEGMPTFSFFNSIIASRGNLNPLILRHEMVHISERHWLDLMIVELCSIVLWFNPIMIFYKRAVKIQHEFLADQGAILNSNECIEEYLRCLVNTVSNYNSTSTISPFGAESIKTRITMMTKRKTHFRFAFLYLLIFPAIAFLLFAFHESPIQSSHDAEPVYVLTEQNIPTDLPVQRNKIQRTFAFGEKFNPVTNKMQHHSGMDFVTNEGENVMSTANGIVVDAGSDEIKGYFVVIKHSNEISTQYFHMRNLAVKKGMTVQKGDVIGFVGTTGLSINNHLHYEVLKNGKAVNPTGYLPENINGC